MYHMTVEVRIDDTDFHFYMGEFANKNTCVQTIQKWCDDHKVKYNKAGSEEVVDNESYFTIVNTAITFLYSKK